MARVVDKGRSGAAASTAAKRSWRRGALKGIAAISVFIVFSGLIVYAYNKGKEAGGGDTPPIIKAGPAPYKLRPVRPGGMQVPNRDKEVYSRIEGAPDRPLVERLLPPAETPLAPTAVAPAAPPPTALAPTVAVLPAPTLAPPRSKPPAAPGAPAATAPTPAPATASAKLAAVGPPNPTKKPAVNARRVAKIAPASGGDYRIQLASLRSPDAVERTWKRFVASHPGLLGGLRLTVVRRDLGSGKGVYYRLQAGPLPDAVAARDLCARLKRRKLNCLVVRP